MILDNNIDISTRIDKHTQLLKDLEEAVHYAISIYYSYFQDREYFKTHSESDWKAFETSFFLSFNIRGCKGTRVTPEVKVLLDNSHAYQVSLDGQDIFRQVDERLVREKLNWNNVELDIYKEHMYDSNYMPK